MKYGFEVLDSNGRLLMDNSSFSILGRKINIPKGKSTISVDDSFVGLGIKGSDLAGNKFSWDKLGNIVTTYSENRSTQAYLFSAPSKASSNNADYGLEVTDNNGKLIFSSEDYHFNIISDNPVSSENNTVSYNADNIYIIHSSGYKIFLLTMFDFTWVWAINLPCLSYSSGAVSVPLQQINTVSSMPQDNLASGPIGAIASVLVVRGFESF